MSGRGGMCAQPFGLRMVDGMPVSNIRLDKIEITDAILGGNTPPEYAIFSEILLKAIHNYWYWGLGKNGCTDVKWLDSVDYLFHIRSDQPETWGEREQRYTEVLEDGTRIKHVEALSDEDMRLRCFDVHYKLLNLDKTIPISGFMKLLESNRKLIVENNREQIEVYLESQKLREFCRMPAGSQMHFTHKVPDFIKTLTRPDSIRQVEELVMFPLPRVRPCRVKPVSEPRAKNSKWKRSLDVIRRTLSGGHLFEEANVGHNDHNPWSFIGGLSPLQVT